MVRESKCRASPNPSSNARKPVVPIGNDADVQAARPRFAQRLFNIRKNPPHVGSGKRLEQLLEARLILLSKHAKNEFPPPFLARHGQPGAFQRRPRLTESALPFRRRFDRSHVGGQPKRTRRRRTDTGASSVPPTSKKIARRRSRLTATPTRAASSPSFRAQTRADPALRPPGTAIP